MHGYILHSIGRNAFGALLHEKLEIKNPVFVGVTNNCPLQIAEGMKQMVKHRASRLAGEIQKEVAEILSRELKDPRLNLATVVDVSVAPDGCSAKVFISPMSGAEHQTEELRQALSSAKGFIRRSLGQRLQVRTVPELFFQVDESIAHAIRMTSLIEKQIAADEEAAKDRPPQEEGIYKE